MTLIPPANLRTVAEIGVGMVGSSWAALMLAKGLKVQAYDPVDGAEERAHTLIAAAWPSLVELKITTLPTPPFEALNFVSSIEAAVSSADIVQENTPEVMSEKSETLQQIGRYASDTTVILSSTGGILPSKLQAFCTHPERLIVFHPFNPTHLIPLIEVVPGEKTSTEVTDWAMELATFLGKKPVRLDMEMVGHMTNRLQFALMREAVRCLLEGVGTAKDIDAAVRYGLAPRWMLLGGLQTLHLAGGLGGMKAILDHAGPEIENWWQPGPDIRLTEEVKATLVQAGADLSNQRDISDWMTWRDAELVPLLHAQSVAEANQPSQHLKEEANS